MPLTQKEISKLFLNSSSMKNYSFPGIMPIGITRFEVFLAIAPILKEVLKEEDSFEFSKQLYEFTKIIYEQYKNEKEKLNT